MKACLRNDDGRLDEKGKEWEENVVYSSSSLGPVINIYLRVWVLLPGMVLYESHVVEMLMSASFVLCVIIGLGWCCADEAPPLSANAVSLWFFYFILFYFLVFSLCG